MGTGSMWGAQRLNDIFKRRVEEILGDSFEEVVRFVGGEDGSPGALLEPLVRSFEKAKHKFSCTTTENIKLRFDSDNFLPQREDLRMGRKWITLTAAQMRSIFDEYMPHIIALVRQQLDEIKEIPRGGQVEISMAGGGSLCKYVQEKIAEAFPDIPVGLKELIE
jgi:hypothetical protein